MKHYVGLGLAMLAGAVLGAAAVDRLHAQAKPLVYTVNEIAVTNEEGFVKDYLPLVRASIKKAGGKALVGTYKVVAIEGAAPKRVAIQSWASMDQVQAWRNGADYKNARKIGDKYASSFIGYAVEGLPQ